MRWGQLGNSFLENEMHVGVLSGGQGGVNGRLKGMVLSIRTCMTAGAYPNMELV